MFVRSLFLSMLAFSSLQVKANTTLPYIGPQSKSCDVKIPESIDIDSGYLASEDCNFIYVLPPVTGAIKFGASSSTWDMMFCPMVDLIQKKITENIERQKNKSLSDAALTKLTEEAWALRRELKKLAGKETVLTAVASAQLGWTKLVDMYQTLNPHITVNKMPLVAGIFSTGLYQQEEYGESVGGVVNKLRVHGLQLPDDFEGIENSPVPDYLSKLKQGEDSINVFMGEGVGLDMMLNLSGACAFRETSMYAIAGTYTYFYPVQTKSFFRVELNTEKLNTDIVSAIHSQGVNGITVENLYDKVKDSQSVTVTLNEGAFSGLGDEERLKEYKEDLVKMVLDNVLGTVSKNVRAVVSSSTDTVTEGRAERRCRKKWGIIRSCHTHRYTVVVSRINWDEVSAKLKFIIGSADAQAESYKTFYMMGTSAMLPQSVQSNFQLKKRR